MLTIPSDMNVTDTSEAQAMKLTSKRMREKEGVRPGADSMAQIAADMDKVADAYLTLTEVPARGVGGEFVQQTGDKSSVVCPPRKKIDRVNTDASLDRLDLVQKNGVLSMALDAAEALNAANAVEQMMAHQMAVAHRTSLDLIADAAPIRDPIEKCRLLNTAAKFMDVSLKIALTVNKLHTGGQQTVLVQHVQVSDGGQAVINGSADLGREGGSKK